MVFHTDLKNLVTEKDHEKLFEYLSNDTIRIDEIIDPISGQRIIHNAVIMDDEFLIDYLITYNGFKKINLAHLMARDFNGYTPLLKAAALGRTNIVKKLVYAGVPINHKDPWGNTPLDKVEIHLDLGQIIISK